VEWPFAATELCNLMAQVEALPLMSINPGVANPNNWARVAFEGGSEPGVLNLTTWLEPDSGEPYCVVTTWNDATQPLEDVTLTRL
jgi:hypothetical protein